VATVTAAAAVTTLAVNTGPATASCTECPWTRTGEGRKAWLAARAAARRHARVLGHQVVIGVVMFHTYGEVARGG
jgi:hypothetical protein